MYNILRSADFECKQELYELKMCLALKEHQDAVVEWEKSEQEDRLATTYTY